MDYKKVYDAICERAKSRELEGYGEMHHIIPKSKGGSNDPSNLVKLTAREHILCHWLLARYTNEAKDWYAFRAMMTLVNSSQNGYRRGSIRMIAEAREKAQGHPDKRKLLSDRMKGNTISGYVRTEDWRKRSREWNLGRKHTQETLDKMSKLHKGTKWVNDGIVSKKVGADEYNTYINEGWLAGRGSTYKRK